MNHERKKLEQKLESAHQLDQVQRVESQGYIEFQTPEELLRYDAQRTPLPEGLEARLADSIAASKRKPSVPWWKRIFGIKD